MRSLIKYKIIAIKKKGLINCKNVIKYTHIYLTFSLAKEFTSFENTQKGMFETGNLYFIDNFKITGFKNTWLPGFENTELLVSNKNKKPQNIQNTCTTLSFELS